METFLYFLAIFVFYFATTICVVAYIFFIHKFSLNCDQNFVVEIFGFKKWCYYFENKKNKYLAWSYFYLIFNLITSVGFTLLWVLIWEGYWYIIAFIIVFLISTFIMIKNTLKYWKYIKSQLCNINEAAKHFKDLTKNTKIDKSFKIEKIEIKKNDKINYLTKIIKNKHHRFCKKIKKNHNNQAKQIYLFTTYLKHISFLVKNMIKNQPIDKFTLYYDNKQKEIDLLPKMLMNGMICCIKNN